MSNAATMRQIFALMDEKDFPSIGELLAPGFPDGKHTFDEVFEIDDRVFARGSFSGTHAGEFMGLPPSGKTIIVTEMTFDRFADGKLVEHHAEADMLGLMQQLGGVPSP